MPDDKKDKKPAEKRHTKEAAPSKPKNTGKAGKRHTKRHT